MVKKVLKFGGTSVGSIERLGIYSLPTSYIFDENGIKIETIVGTIIWDSETIINKLKITPRNLFEHQSGMK